MKCQSCLERRARLMALVLKLKIAAAVREAVDGAKALTQGKSDADV